MQHGDAASVREEKASDRDALGSAAWSEVARVPLPGAAFFRAAARAVKMGRPLSWIFPGSPVDSVVTEDVTERPPEASGRNGIQGFSGKRDYSSSS